MFGKLKNKLKDWTAKVAGEDETIEELKEEGVSEKEILEEKEEEFKEKKGFFKKMFSKKEEETEELAESEKPKKETKKKIESEPKEKETSKEKSMVKTVKSVPKKKAEVEEVKKETKKKITNKKEIKEKSIKTPNEEIKEKSDSITKEEVITKEKESKSAPKAQDKLLSTTDSLPATRKRSLFSKLTSSKKTITENEFMDYSEDLEMILLENNVALEVVDKIIDEIKKNIVDLELSKKEIMDTITRTLKEKIEEVLIEPFNIIEEIKAKDSPYVMIFCGINGVGKTTQIAKFAHMLKEKGITSVMAAGDTFRAAAVEQIQYHGEKLDIKVIAHDYGSDPASVGFDAIKYAKKNNIDVVLIDTAGRIHTATNLLQEMAKIKRVCKPDRTIFVGESICGNDAVDQIKAFDEHIGIDGIFLSKADIDEKGGTALSVGYITGKPIIYLGTGQNYEDIEPFNKKKFLEKLGL